MDRCFVCQTEMFTGWVENPMYRDNGSGLDEEIVIEMNISYCPQCKKLSHSELKIRAIDVEDETHLQLGGE